MDIIKVTICILSVGLMLTGCDSHNDKAEVERLQKEVEQLRIERNQMTEQTAKAQKIIDGIWGELNTLSGRAFDLRKNKENRSRTQNLNKAEEIAKDIRTIRKKLNEAEKAEGVNETMRNTIKYLRITIQLKEKEIKQLKNDIQNLKKININLDSALQNREKELNKTATELNISKTQQQIDQLRRKVDNIVAWERTGDALMKSVKKIGPKKGNGNMAEVKEAQLEMISHAIDCYQNAYDLGHTESILNKLNNAKRCYNTYLTSEYLIF